MSAPEELTVDWLKRSPLPAPEEDGDKDGRGRVLVVAGSRQVPGAAVLAATSALRAGAGKLQVAVGRSLATAAAFALPEALVMGLGETVEGGIDPSAAEGLRDHVERCDALLIGPGMIGEDAVGGLAGRLLESRPAHGVVLDAAAIDAVKSCREVLARHAGRVILTPHAGEMASLLGKPKAEIIADPLAAAREASAAFSVVVALKGRKTFIVAPDGRSVLNLAGHVGLATSGSGDTLAGLMTGLLARGADPFMAAAYGVFVHAEAGERLGTRYGGIGYLARELPAEFPAVLGEL